MFKKRIALLAALISVGGAAGALGPVVPAAQAAKYTCTSPFYPKQLPDTTNSDTVAHGGLPSTWVHEQPQFPAVLTGAGGPAPLWHHLSVSALGSRAQPAEQGDRRSIPSLEQCLGRRIGDWNSHLRLAAAGADVVDIRPKPA